MTPLALIILAFAASAAIAAALHMRSDDYQQRRRIRDFKAMQNALRTNRNAQ